MTLSPNLRSELVAAMERGPRPRRAPALVLAVVAVALVSGVYDLTQHRAAVAIQPPRWFDHNGKPVRRPWTAGRP